MATIELLYRGYFFSFLGIPKKGTQPRKLHGQKAAIFWLIPDFKKGEVPGN